MALLKYERGGAVCYFKRKFRVKSWTIQVVISVNNNMYLNYLVHTGANSCALFFPAYNKDALRVPDMSLDFSDEVDYLLDLREVNDIINA